MTHSILRPFVLATIALLTLAGCKTETIKTAEPARPVVVPANGLAPLTGKIFGTGSEIVIILLHGDVSRGGPANYMHPFAEQVSLRFTQAKVISMLRPGYTDGIRTSPGTNHNRRDQYTAENNRLLADTIANLKAANPGAQIIVMGHSGGAAQLGAVIGQRAGLVDGAVLLSCPCNIDRWRQGYRPFLRSQSPSKFAKTTSPDTRVIAITGSADKNTWPMLAKKYVDQLKAVGVDAKFVEVPGAGHHYLAELGVSVMEALDELIQK